jgi:serine acetyltransferase
MRALPRDFARNPWPLDRATLIVFRFGQQVRTRGILLRFLWWILDLVYLRLLIGAELPPDVDAGPGLRLPHAGRGVILHPTARLGEDVTLYHRVTLGNSGRRERAPVLGDRVYVGTGATIIGEVTVGEGAAVGAGAVVTHDVDPETTVTGVPARPHRTRSSAEADG